MGPGLSIAEALRSRADPPYLVHGYVWARDDRVQLCTRIEAATPPRCGGPSLRVRGLDLARVRGLQTEGETRWTEAPLPLLGEVRDGVITVAANTQG